MCVMFVYCGLGDVLPRHHDLVLFQEHSSVRAPSRRGTSALVSLDSWWTDGTSRGRDEDP